MSKYKTSLFPYDNWFLLSYDSFLNPFLVLCFMQSSGQWTLRLDLWSSFGFPFFGLSV